jgi:Tol biopolymer transport system component
MAVTDNAAIRSQLTKILSSPVFVNSPRMMGFLKYVVETTIEGNGERIKEYVIALEVFKKSETYDPQADSTVRTEASKLRTRLGRYYETEGQRDPVVISIPKGGYLAAFEDRRNGTATTSRAHRPIRVKVFAAVSAAIIAVAAGMFWLLRPSSSPVPRLVPLTSYPGLEEQPSLSPDGSQVAFRWKGDIYLKEVGSEAVLQITKDPAVDSWPAWSPDASQIAFVRRGEVFVVSPLGGGERKVAESAGRVAWTPDDSAILVLQKTSALALSIFKVTLANGEKRRLTFPSDQTPGDLDMAISPDGRTVAFCRVVNTLGCELFVAPAGGGEARRLTNDQRMIYGMAWTPDGREIVFASTRQNSMRLWRVHAHPAQQTDVFETPKLVEAAGDDARCPSISRNSRLAYQQYSRNWDIRRAEIVGPEGTSAQRLKRSTPLIASTRLDGAPAWSPDGTKIAFLSDRSGDFELWICGADGSNPVRLTTFGGPGVINPRWSADGRRIIFSALTGPNSSFEGYFINAKGGAPERIRAPAQRSMAYPILSRDGRWIYFIPGPQERAVEAWRIPSTGGEAVQITRHGAFQPEESPDGKLLYYGKYGTHGLWSTPVEGGEERQVLDSISGGNWTVAPGGIYYFDFPGEPSAPKLAKFYSFKSGRSNQIGTVEPTVLDGYAGFSLSPDGRWLLYTDIVTTNSDLMLIDHFRW